MWEGDLKGRTWTKVEGDRLNNLLLDSFLVWFNVTHSWRAAPLPGWLTASLPSLAGINHFCSLQPGPCRSNIWEALVSVALSSLSLTKGKEQFKGSWIVSYGSQQGNESEMIEGGSFSRCWCLFVLAWVGVPRILWPASCSKWSLYRESEKLINGLENWNSEEMLVQENEDFQTEC